MPVRSRNIIKKLTVAAGMVFSLVAIPVQAAQAVSVIWTVYEISFKPPCDLKAPKCDYPGVGSR